MNEQERTEVTDALAILRDDLAEAAEPVSPAARIRYEERRERTRQEITRLERLLSSDEASE